MPYGFNPDKSKFNVNRGTINKNRNLIFIGDSYQVGTDNNNVSFLKYFKEWYGTEFGDIYHAEQHAVYQAGSRNF